MTFRDRMKNRGFNPSDFRTFEHETVVLPEIEAVTTETGRVYKVPGDKEYPSITTVLSINSKDSIEKWRKRVGEEEANRISHIASERGTRVHEMCEDYLFNRYAEGKPVPDVSNDRSNFLKIKRVLDANVGTVYALEVPLYSDTLQVAGRTDLIADWGNSVAVIDFKTATKPKEEKWIQNYFQQATAYTKMWHERVGWEINKFVIVIAVDNHPAQVFIGYPEDYYDDLLVSREKYRKVYRR